MPKGLPGGIDSVGSSDWSGVGVPLNNVEAVFAQFAQEFIAQASNNLQKAGAVSSGELISSMKFNISPVNQGYRLTITMADYWDFVNKGVKGVKSGDKSPNSPYSFKTLTVGYQMAHSIQKWAARHNLKAVKQNKVFKHKQVKTFTDTSEEIGFAIAMGIKKHGLKATYFYDATYEKLMPGLAPALAKALQQDVAQVMRTLVVKRGEIT